MFYIRFLKPPALSQGPATELSLRLVLTIATDLGDEFLFDNVDLVIAIKQAAPGEEMLIQACWLKGSRALPVQLNLGGSRLKTPIQVLVSCKETARYECASESDGVLVMPKVVPLESLLIQPEQNQLEPQRLAIRKFHMSKNKTLSVYEDTGESIARHVWDAGVALSLVIDKCFNNHYNSLPALAHCLGRSSNETLSVLELGAGCGIVGLAVAAVVPNCRVLLTDIEDFASRNIPHSASNVFFHKLDWDQTLPEAVSNQRFDLILAADCTYNPDSSPSLVKIISSLPRASKDSLVIIASKERHPSEAVFFELMDKEGFRCNDKVSVKDVGPSMHDGFDDEKCIDIYSFTRDT